MNASVVLVYSNLGLGGIPVRIVDIVNELALTQPTLKICILLKEKRGFDLRSEISNPRVTIFDFWTFSASDNAFLFIIWAWWKIFVLRPKTLISFISPYGLPTLFTKILFFWRKSRIIIDEGHYTSTMVDTMMFPAIQRMGIKYLYPLADTIIAPTTAVKNNLMTYFRIPSSLIQVIPNWTKHGNNPITHSKRPIDLIYVGRFEPKKNVINLLKLVHEIIHKHKPKVQCIFIGEGSLKDQMQAYLSRHNLENNVTIIGPVKNVFPYLGNSKIFLLNSDQNSEGFPVSLLDAMAAGAIIITTRFSGATDVLTKNNAYLVDTVFEMKQTILEVLRHFSSQKLIRSRAKTEVIQLFSNTAIQEFISTF